MKLTRKGVHEQMRMAVESNKLDHNGMEQDLFEDVLTFSQGDTQRSN